ncbi:hypothetical protein ES705_26656 [subsurface metagenome]
MLGATLLRLVTAVTPDDVKELKAAGCMVEAKVLLEMLHRVAVHWHGTGPVDKKVWAGVQVRLNQLRAALREGSDV